MLSAMGSIEELIPGAAEQTTLPSRGSRAPKVLLTVGLILALVIVLPVAGWVAIKTFIWPTQETSTGTCAVYDPHSCTDLKLMFLEEVARLDFPDDSEVVDSGTGKFLFAGSEWGLVRLPEDADPFVIAPVPDGMFNESRMEQFEEHGFVTVDGVSSFTPEGRYHTEVIVGTDDSGRTLVLIDRGWNG